MRRVLVVPRNYEQIWATLTPKECVLVEGLRDWMYPGWVTGYLREEVPEALWRSTALGIIAEMLVEGLVVAGEVNNGHHPWDCTPGEAIERITREWITGWPEDVPFAGDIAWLANTEAGNEIARAVLARDGISE